MSKLVIVESPAKASTIAKYLGSAFDVKASMGHLRDLPKKEMGVDVENGFAAKYIAIDGKDKIIDDLKKASKKSEMVYLATDPDREGEAISWHLKELLGLDDEKSCRVTFNEITKRAVIDGVANPRSINEKLVDAQQTRRILDRIVGYKLSPFLWKKIRRGLSAGRVQSVVTRLIVDREREIQAFIPKEYWSITVKLSKSSKTFDAKFYGDQKGKIELSSKQDTDHVLNTISGQDYSVISALRRDKRRSPAPPFTTSTLQQEASRKLNMTSKRTMAVAQQLYEGINVEGIGMSGLITYMRTDSLRVSEDAIADVRGYISGHFESTYLPAKAKYYKSKGSAQDAHEAVRPSNVALSPDSIKGSLSSEQYKLYKMIWSRFVASQMVDAVYDTITADVLCAGYIFRVTGSIIKFPGFIAVYEESRDDSEDDENTALPELSEGDSLKYKDTVSEQHFTQPPPRYTEASLIKEMEERGIGRPSTYAPTISTIVDRDYVVKEAKRLRPTNLGEVVTDLMKDKFQDIIDVKFTALMEDKLDEVESGKVEYREVLKAFYDDFDRELKQAEKDLEKQRIKVKDEVSDVICDVCGRNMVIKSGRFGKFLACPGYPECKNTKPIAVDAGVLCPICGAKVLKKKSKTGHIYLGCEKNPACTFMTWDKPTKKACPKCGGTLYRHYVKETKKNINVCLNTSCDYQEEPKK